MKKEILTLIIGILIGAIITTGIFLVLKNNDKQKKPTIPNFERNFDSNNNRDKRNENFPEAKRPEKVN